MNWFFITLGYSGLDDRLKSSADALYISEGSAGDDKRLGEGYIEFIVMGYTEVNPTDVSAGNTVGYNNTFTLIPYF